MRLEAGAGLPQELANDVESVGAAVERQPRLAVELDRQAVAMRAGLVRRIAEDHVVLHRRHGIEDVAAMQMHASAEPAGCDVDLRHLERLGREINRVHLGRGKMLREQDGEAARAGADVGDARNLCRVGQPGVELLRDDLEEIAARDEHALVDIESLVAEPGFPREVGRGRAVHDAATEDIRELPPLGRAELARQHLGSAVERQVERAQDEVERLVVGAGRDLPECEAVLAVERRDCREPATGGGQRRKGRERIRSAGGHGAGLSQR